MLVISTVHVNMLSLLHSTLSGMLVRIPLHPIDTMKARLQVQSGTAGCSVVYKNVADALYKSYARQGIASGWYPGFGITFFGSAPAACLYFT